MYIAAQQWMDGRPKKKRKDLYNVDGLDGTV